MTLADFYFHFFSSDPVSVCVLLYGIILIQILIKYNVHAVISLLHAPDYVILTPKIEKISLPWEGPPPTPSLPLGRFASSGLVAPLRLPRICYHNIFCAFLEVRNHPPPPPTHTLLKTCLRHWL